MKYYFFECVLIKIFTNMKYFREILYMFEEWKENAFIVPKLSFLH